MNSSDQGMNRRDFIRRSLRGAGVLATCVAGAEQLARAAAPGNQANPFAYDLDRISKTDPKLIQYEEVSRFRCPVSEPRRIAVGPNSQLYVAGGKGVVVLGNGGGSVLDIALEAQARAVSVAADGTVYVAVRDHVEVYDAKGRRLGEWASPGKKVWFTGLAVGENDVFAADAGNRVVLRYDRSGKVAGRIGEKNKERNVPGIIVPSPYLDVELGRDGLLRVNNPGRHCIETYTVEGDLEFSWGKASASIEGFCGCCNPIGLALLADGRCVTCEKGLPRVKVYSADGTFECVVAGPESFPENAKSGALSDKSDGMLGGLDAAVDSQGRIYILDLVAANIRVMKRKAGEA